MINRYAHCWGLSVTTLSQINSLVDEPNRPLGEAVALLSWNVFEDSTYENDQDHLARLNTWGSALTEYRDQLQGKIDIQETRFGRWLGIWSLWREREKFRLSRGVLFAIILGMLAALTQNSFYDSEVRYVYMMLICIWLYSRDYSSSLRI